MADNILQVKNLTKRFGENLVLDGIDLEVSIGERIAIIGSSGCGKSTLLRCLNLLEEPTSGEIIFDGEPLTSGDINSKRQKIGMVFQNFNLFPHMSVLKNIVMAPKLHEAQRIKAEAKAALKEAGADRKAVSRNKKAALKELPGALRKKAEQLLIKFGLESKINEYPHSLSGGQKQRVAIIRALICDPKIMLFDEPTSALDPETIKEVLDVIRLLAENGQTILLVTHEIKFAREFASKVIFLDEGKIVESGPPRQIFDAPKTQRVKDFLSKMLG